MEACRIIHVLIGQSDDIKSHSHNMSHKHTINHGHTLNLYGRGDNAVGGNEKVLRSGDSKLSGCGSIANYNGYSSYDLYNDASTPAKITNTENTGGTETRSTNFSVRICKRMS